MRNKKNHIIKICQKLCWFQIPVFIFLHHHANKITCKNYVYFFKTSFGFEATSSSSSSISSLNVDDDSYGSPRSPLISSEEPSIISSTTSSSIDGSSYNPPTDSRQQPVVNLEDSKFPESSPQPHYERLILTSSDSPPTSTFPNVVNGHSSPVEVIEAIIDKDNPLEHKFEQKGDGMSQSINLKINVVVGDLERPVKASLIHEQTTGQFMILKSN